MIDGEVTNSDSLSRVSLEAAYVFVLFWTLADDFGRFDGRTRLLLSRLFPLREDITLDALQRWIDELVTEECLHRYEVDGRIYLHCPEWERYQRLRYESTPKWPTPPCCGDLDKPAAPGGKPPDSAAGRGEARRVAAGRGEAPQAAAKRGGSRQVAASSGKRKRIREESEVSRASPSLPLPPEAVAASLSLGNAILKSTPKAKLPKTLAALVRWAHELRRLVELDGWTWPEVEAVIAWLPSHRGSRGFAWGRVILSAVKLREHFPQLAVARTANGGGRGAQAPRQAETRDEPGPIDLQRELDCQADLTPAELRSVEIRRELRARLHRQPKVAEIVEALRAEGLEEQAAQLEALV